MIAYVLSGGGNYGAMQAGALMALAEQGIKPDIIIGTSAGAINGSLVAYDPSAENMARLAGLWRSLSNDVLYPGGYAAVLWRLAKGEPGLFSSEGMKTFLSAHAPQNIHTLADLKAARLYVTATEIPGGKLRVFGENPSDSLIDALLASASLPPLHPPHKIGDTLYVDGGLAAKFPLRLAVEKGATTIYALHVYHNPAEHPYDDSLLATARWSIAKLLHDQDEVELAWARNQRRLKLHYLQLKSPLALSAIDFSHSGELIEAGYTLTKAYLNAIPVPPGLRLAQQWQKLMAQLRNAPRRLKIGGGQTDAARPNINNP